MRTGLLWGERKGRMCARVWGEVECEVGRLSRGEAENCSGLDDSSAGGRIYKSLG